MADPPSFCLACATQLTFIHSGLPGEIDVTAHSLDTPEPVPLTAPHVRIASKLPRVYLAEVSRATITIISAVRSAAAGLLAAVA